jgi:lysophospholipase L1-like esterase
MRIQTKKVAINHKTTIMYKKLLLSLLAIFSFQFFILACSGENVKEGAAKPAFEGKNLATFGNSITAADNSWAYQLSKKLNFGNLYNGAVGGAIWSKRERKRGSSNTIRTQNYNDPGFAGISNSNAANPDDLEYQKRINNCAIVHIQKYISQKTAPVPDFIIISYGTNDLSSVATLGDAAVALREENPDNLDVYTLAGSVKWCLKTLRDKFPGAKLYVSLPIQAKSEKRNEDNLRKIGVIKKLCNGMSVPYFDCYAESGITQENSEQFLRDGLHPNEEGKTLHANYIIKKLKEANE